MRGRRGTGGRGAGRGAPGAGRGGGGRGGGGWVPGWRGRVGWFRGDPREGGGRGLHTGMPSFRAACVGDSGGRGVTSSGAARELEVEQAYVSRLYGHLDAARERTSAALSEVRRAPMVPTPGGRSEREAFEVLHSQRLDRLNAVEDRLCFGRLDLRAGERRYVGRLGISDEA